MWKLRSLLLGLAWGVSSGALASDLLEIYFESMASDPRLQLAEAEAAIFQAREDNSFGALLPQVNLVGVGTRTARDSANAMGQDLPREYYSGERYAVSLTQPLYDKQRWEAYRGSTKEAEQYSARLQETRGEVAVDVVDRYTGVLAAEDSLAFVVAEREAAEEQLKQTNARYQRQLARVTDVLALEARVNVLFSRELDARNQVAMARENLSEVLGREVNEPFPVLREDIFLDWHAGLLEDWTRQALGNSNGLEASRLAVQAAERRVKQAAAQRHPTLSVSLNAQQSDIGFENSQIPEFETYVAALNFNMPLYTGGQITAQVEENRARLLFAQQQYSQMNRQLRRDVRQAYLNAGSATERVAATRKAVESAEKSYEAQQKGFEYGTVTVVDILTAAETLYGARREHRQAYYDLMTARMSLHQVSGNFSAEQIAEINDWLRDQEATDG